MTYLSIYSFSSVLKELRKSLQLALPLIASEVVYGLSQFSATAMLGHLGKEELAVNAIVWGIFVALLLFFMGILMSVGVLVSQSNGANNQHGIQQSGGQGIVLAVILSIPMAVILWYAPIILHWTNQDPKIIELATPYFHAWCWCTLPINILVVIEQFLSGMGKTRLVLLMSAVQVPFSIIFYYILIFGKFGFPNCGLLGVAYGMSMSFGIIAFLAMIFIHYSKETRSFKLLHGCFPINLKYLFEIVRVGWPLAIGICLELSLFATISIMMGKLGSTFLAAHQITLQCLNISLSFIFGIMGATTIRVGYEVGQNNRSALILAAYSNMLIGFFIIGIFALVYINFPKLIIGLDVDINNEKYALLVKYAVSFLSIAGLLQLTDCIRLISTAALRGLKDTKIPMIISITTFWFIAFPSAYLLAFHWNFGGIGLWYGMLIGLSICAISLLIRFNILAKKIDLVSLVIKD